MRTHRHAPAVTQEALPHLARRRAEAVLDAVEPAVGLIARDHLVVVLKAPPGDQIAHDLALAPRQPAQDGLAGQVVALGVRQAHIPWGNVAAGRGPRGEDALDGVQIREAIAARRLEEVPLAELAPVVEDHDALVQAVAGSRFEQLAGLAAGLLKDRHIGGAVIRAGPRPVPRSRVPALHDVNDVGQRADLALALPDRLLVQRAGSIVADGHALDVTGVRAIGLADQAIGRAGVPALLAHALQLHAVGCADAADDPQPVEPRLPASLPHLVEHGLHVLGPPEVARHVGGDPDVQQRLVVYLHVRGVLEELLDPVGHEVVEQVLAVLAPARAAVLPHDRELELVAVLRLEQPVMDRMADALVNLRGEVRPVPAVDEPLNPVLQGHLDVPVGDFRRALVVEADRGAAVGPRLDLAPAVVRALFPQRAVVHQGQEVWPGGRGRRDIAGLRQVERRREVDRQLHVHGAEAIGGEAHAERRLRRPVRLHRPRHQLGGVVAHHGQRLGGRANDTHSGRHDQRGLHVRRGLAEAADRRADLLGATGAGQGALGGDAAHIQVRPALGAARHPDMAQGELGPRSRVLQRERQQPQLPPPQGRGAEVHHRGAAVAPHRGHGAALAAVGDEDQVGELRAAGVKVGADVAQTGQVHIQGRAGQRRRGARQDTGERPGRDLRRRAAHRRPALPAVRAAEVGRRRARRAGRVGQLAQLARLGQRRVADSQLIHPSRAIAHAHRVVGRHGDPAALGREPLPVDLQHRMGAGPLRHEVNPLPRLGQRPADARLPGFVEIHEECETPALTLGVHAELVLLVLEHDLLAVLRGLVEIDPAVHDESRRQLQIGMAGDLDRVPVRVEGLALRPGGIARPGGGGVVPPAGGVGEGPVKRPVPHQPFIRRAGRRQQHVGQPERQQ